MAKYETHEKDRRARIIVAGDSGSGKTGLLATVANAGYRTCIIDADNGLDVLDAYLTDEGRENLHYITLKDNVEKRTSAWGEFVKILTNGWKDDEEDLGKIDEWDENSVLVLDTLDFLGKAAMRVVMSQAGKALDAQPEIQHWGDAQRMLEQRIAALCSPTIKCHLIVNTHLKQVEDSIGRSQHYPAMCGTAPSLYIGDYFNTVVRLDTKAKLTGEAVRTIRTTSDNKMNLKSSVPTTLKPEETFDLGHILDTISGKT